MKPTRQESSASASSEPITSGAVAEPSKAVPPKPRQIRALDKFFRTETLKKGPFSAYEAEKVTYPPPRSVRVLRSNKADSASIPSRPSSPPPVRRVKSKKPILKTGSVTLPVEPTKLTEPTKPIEESVASTPSVSHGSASEPRNVPTETAWTFRSFWHKIYSRDKAKRLASGKPVPSVLQLWRRFQHDREEFREYLTDSSALSFQSDTPIEPKPDAVSEHVPAAQRGLAQKIEGGSNQALYNPDIRIVESSATPTQI